MIKQQDGSDFKTEGGEVQDRTPDATLRNRDIHSSRDPELLCPHQGEGTREGLRGVLNEPTAQ